MAKTPASSPRGGRAGATTRRTSRKIDYTDVPEASPEQLKSAARGPA